MKVNNIVIVGGGSSGWMTAAGLIKSFPQLNIKVIESTAIPTIGVGESTLGPINEYFNILGLKDEEWMPHCNASYKISIRFEDFKQLGSEYHYPFGGLDLFEKNSIHDWFDAKALDSSIDDSTFAEFYNTYYMEMIRQNKISDDNAFGINTVQHRAYHFDAALLGVYLRDQYCKPKGVTHIDDKVLDAELNEDGSIKNLICESGKIYDADLFIDCTGFASILIEKKMGMKFISFSDNLMNDSAIAGQIQYSDISSQYNNYTNCKAMSSGWIWEIPLYTRVGAGYVYSSKFITDDDAEQEYRTHVRNKYGEEAESKVVTKRIKIRHGMKEKAWVKNVIAIGLSYGFIEPLESTGLLTTHNNVIRLIDTLGRRNCEYNKFDADMFNYGCATELLKFKHFVALHYSFSLRDDTPYWKYVTQELDYSKEMNSLEPVIVNLYEEMAQRINWGKGYNWDMKGLLWIAAGNGINYTSSHRIKYQKLIGNMFDEKQGLNIFNHWKVNRKKQIENYVSKLKNSYEFHTNKFYLKQET